MIIRDLRFLCAAAALVCSTAPAPASPAADPAQRSVCRPPQYPPQSLAYAEEGLSVIAFLVDEDGKVKRSVILNSSGSADLDRAADRALSKCRFKPTTVDGKAVEGWVPVQYLWVMDDDPGMSRAKHDAEVASAKGDIVARYQLSLLLLRSAKSDTERQQSDSVLRSAADMGYAPAQFALGLHYEEGTRIKADIEEAVRWYQKAAAQGDVLAIQRLRVGPHAN